MEYEGRAWADLCAAQYEKQFAFFSAAVYNYTSE